MDGETRTIRVLGVDLASARWVDNGVALLAFRLGAEPRWLGARLGADRPEAPVTAEAAADWIDSLARSQACGAVSLDGPQGWRSPGTPAREPGVGRRCDLEARTQGKCGVRGICYPYTQIGWIGFCIDVFELLLRKPGVCLANSATSLALVPVPDGYWLLESFPTSVWRTSGLLPLRGKARATPEDTATALQNLSSAYGFRVESEGMAPSHDDVQALAAALPAAALLGAPAVPVPRGVLSAVEADGSRSEGIIWDARPMTGAVTTAAKELADLEAYRQDQQDSAAACDPDNPFLPDSRDHVAFGEILECGRRLLGDLAARANRGEVVGMGYQQLLLALYGADTLGELLGMPGAKWSQAYAKRTVRLAVLITREVGRVRVQRGPHAIDSGLDTFIWSGSRLDRPAGAWTQSWTRLPYSRQEWERVLPAPRRLLRRDEVRKVLGKLG